MFIVNQIRLAGEEFTYQRVVEKIMVRVPDKFEAKISALEESCDLTMFSVANLISKLQAREQRNYIYNDEYIEGAFHAMFKGKKSVARNDKIATKNQESKAERGAPRKGKYPPCHYCKKTNRIEKNCWSKNKQFFHCNYCNKDSHIERYCYAKKN